jgi:hypothetical protein
MPARQSRRTEIQAPSGVAPLPLERTGELCQKIRSRSIGSGMRRARDASPRSQEAAGLLLNR